MTSQLIVDSENVTESCFTFRNEAVRKKFILTVVAFNHCLD